MFCSQIEHKKYIQFIRHVVRHKKSTYYNTIDTIAINCVVLKTSAPEFTPMERVVIIVIIHKVSLASLVGVRIMLHSVFSPF